MKSLKSDGSVDLLAASDIRQLMGQSGICVSICMPTHRCGAETLQDPIRLKNLLRDARSQLRGLGLDAPMIHQILAPVADLVEDYGFWQHQYEGLAVYCSPESSRCFRTPLPLPELSVVASRFHLKPLLPLLPGNSHFYVLALSQHQARLFLASRDQISELQVPAWPPDRCEAHRVGDGGGALQSHSVGHGALRVSVFHGHEESEEEKKERVIEYFRQVGLSLVDALPEDGTPLILAGVDYLLPIFRRSSRLPQLLEETVSGNVDDLTPQALLEKALPIALNYFSRAEDRAARQFHQLLHIGLASSGLATVLDAASVGRVQTLFVAVGVQIWGTYRPEGQLLVIHDGPAPPAEDLLNLAAMYTFMNSGQVWAVPPARVPGGGHLAAAFRY